MITYEYNMYRNKHLSLLDRMLLECCFVWNHALELQRRYYKIYGQYDLNENLIKKYVGNNELRRNNYSPERVNWCARGKTKTAHGCKWKIEGKCKKSHMLLKVTESYYKNMI